MLHVFGFIVVSKSDRPWGRSLCCGKRVAYLLHVARVWLHFRQRSVACPMVGHLVERKEPPTCAMLHVSVGIFLSEDVIFLGEGRFVARMSCLLIALCACLVSFSPAARDLLSGMPRGCGQKSVLPWGVPLCREKEYLICQAVRRGL
jgi:hypothetical protein